ncbi:MAG: type II toxin-antitoxin system VapC family toxin [Chloroflexi bacterium]|nr:type II toxin-antitoxin system VapC family toxin [Chloroflexota bacterium]
MRFIDTNIFIYALTAHPTFGQTAKRILERLEKGEEAVTSTLVLFEISWVLEAMGKQGDIKPTLEKILSYKALKTVEVTPDDLLMGAENMAEYGVDFNDGVNVALMMRLGICEVYSNDKKHLGKLDFLKTIFS